MSLSEFDLENTPPPSMSNDVLDLLTLEQWFNPSAQWL